MCDGESKNVDLDLVDRCFDRSVVLPMALFFAPVRKQASVGALRADNVAVAKRLMRNPRLGRRGLLSAVSGALTSRKALFCKAPVGPKCRPAFHPNTLQDDHPLTLAQSPTKASVSSDAPLAHKPPYTCKPRPPGP